MFEALKEKIKDPDQTLDATERKLVEKIRKAVGHLALYEAYPYLPLMVDEKGLREVRRKDGLQEEELADTKYRNAQRYQLHQDGLFYIAQLKEYLNSVSDASTYVAYYEAFLKPDANDDIDDFTNTPHIVL